MNSNKISSIDKQWRLFFYGENHQILSNILVTIFNDFLKISLKYEIILDTPDNQQILKRIDHNDISHTAKLADTFFETRFFNRAGNTIKCNLNSALKKFHKDPSKILNVNELDELKLDIHRSGQFETISKIILQARNINAHWHAPIEDAGNAALVSGAILRLIELFDLDKIDIDKVDKLRNISTNLILSIGMYENNEIDIVSNIDKETKNNKEKLKIPLQEEVVREKFINENISLKDNSIDDEKINLPDINFQPKNTLEQKRQSLMKLSYELLDDKRLEQYKITRSNCLLSRHCIKDFLGIKNPDENKINSCLTVSFMRAENKEALDMQMKYYVVKILTVLGN